MSNGNKDGAVRQTMDESGRRDWQRRQREQTVINAYHRVFATEDGAMVLDDLRSVFRQDEQVFTPVKRGDHFAYDPLTAALADGARGVLVYIRQRLKQKVQGDANVEPAEKVKR